MIFWRYFLVLVFGMLAGRALGGSRARFGVDLRGFWRGLGRVWERESPRKYEILAVLGGMRFEICIFVEFCLMFDRKG